MKFLLVFVLVFLSCQTVLSSSLLNSLHSDNCPYDYFQCPGDKTCFHRNVLCDDFFDCFDTRIDEDVSGKFFELFLILNRCLVISKILRIVINV